MRRSVLSVWLVTALVFVTSAACGDSNPTVPTPTPAPPVTDTFTGTINTNGAMTFQFTAATGGFVTVTLTSVQPDSTTTIAVGLGTFNTSTNVCTIQPGLTIEKATQGATFVASVSVAGTLCLRVADSGGTLTGPTTFSVDVAHP